MKVTEHSLMDPAIQEDPFAYYDALLDEAPVFFMPEINAYVVSKYKDIQFVVAHPEIQGHGRAFFAGAKGGPRRVCRCPRY